MLFCFCVWLCAAGAGRGRKKPPRKPSEERKRGGSSLRPMCGLGERVVVGLWIDNERVQCLVRLGDCSLLFVGEPFAV